MNTVGPSFYLRRCLDQASLGELDLKAGNAQGGLWALAGTTGAYPGSKLAVNERFLWYPGIRASLCSIHPSGRTRRFC